jgi:hypothetical protein
MNDASVAEQKQIFEASLDGAELAALNALIARHQANAALTQQLALDASKLVTTSQERLAQQAGAGFFKRFASAISGKTGEHQAQNQVDMLRLQKFAWHYLQQLQQQNLINAQSIAVIRNNLGTMNTYIIETRDFLEQAVDKIDQRLRHVENNTSFNNWSLGIEANKRRLKSNPRTLLILRLTYDFMGSHPGVLLSERNVANYLVNTLEKLDINCDEEVTLIDFISDLIEQIELPGIDQYRKMIALSFDEHSVDAEFIQKNISGTSFNALYFLTDHYERIVDLTSDQELVNSDEARAKIISKFFGSEFSALATTYSIRHLICEIIGGSQLAIDVYKEANGLNAAQEQAAEAPPQQPERAALVSSLPEIHAHTFFDGTHSNEAKRNYLRSLALCVASSASLTPPALEFVALLSAQAGHADLQQDLVRLADNPRKLNEYQPVIQALLDDEDKKITWLLDAFFLLSLAREPIESPQVRAVLGVLKPAQLKEVLPNLVALVDENDSSRVLEAALKLAPATQGWKNLVRYRSLRFEPYFEEALKGLNAAGWANVRIAFEVGEVYRKGLEHAYYFSFRDDSLLGNLAEKASAAVCSQGRRSALSGLNELRKKTRGFLSEHRSALHRANGLVSRWGIPLFEFKDEISYIDFDLNNSSENEEWGTHFEGYYNQIQSALDSFEQACNDATEQLKFFMAGDFDQSVFALKEQKRAQYIRQQLQEKLEKQSVTMTRDGAEHRLTIDWQQVAKPPCDAEQISHIETDSKVWLIVASIKSEDVFYRSEDGEHWQQVQLDTPQFKVSLHSISVVNGVWIIRNRALREGRAEGIYYSSDALEWRYNTGPGGAGNGNLSLSDGHLYYQNIIHFKGMWLWAVTQQQRYSYTETGFFTDSTKTDSYNKTILFAAQTLGDAWQRWDQSPQFNEGVEVNNICSLPGDNALLAFCEYSSSYIRYKKKPDTPPFVMYFGAAKLWQTCAWDGGRRYYSSDRPVFVQQDDKLMCFMSSEIFVSAKGYDWSPQETRLRVDLHLALPWVHLFAERSGSAVHLSQDCKQFKELALDEGTWRYLTANQGGMLGVHYANRHEETVLRVGRIICQAKL